MADNVIKEFLISLGVETNGVDKFDDQIDVATAKAVAFGEAMYDLAKVVARAVADMVTGFDQLYWQSKNLGSAAGDIRAAGYAFSQLGGSAGMASAAMKSISDFTLTFGGGAKSFLAGLGVDPHDIGDAAKTMRDLEVIFQRMVATGGPNALARVNQIAGVLGLSSDQLRVMLRDSGEYEDQYATIAKQMGINLDDASKASNDLMIRIRLLQAQFELWADNEGIKAIKGLAPYIQAISDKIAAIPGDKMQIAGDVIAGAFGAIAIAAVVAYAPLIALAGAIALVLKAEQDWEKGDAWIKFRHETPEERQKRQADPANPAGKGFFGGLEAMWHSNWFSTSHPDAVATAPSPAVAGSGGTDNDAIGSARWNNPGNLRNANGRGFQSFGSVDAGALAMARQLERYSQRGLSTIRSIVSTWAPSSENNTGAYIADVARRMGVNPDAFLNLNSSAVLARLMSGMIHHEQGHDVLSLANLQALLHSNAASIMGGTHLGVSQRGGVSLSQQTNINIHGGGNSRDVANDVAAHQDAVNQRMVANAGVFAY